MENDALTWLKDHLSLSFRRKVPVMLQTEAAECGLACLTMIASYHGRRTNILALRQDFGISARGATLTTLTGITGALGLASRALSLDLDELNQLSLPCLLHWDFNHFVVLTQIKGESVVIHDPAIGRRVVKRKELSEHFTGVALELWPETGFIRENRQVRIKISELLRNISGFRSALLKIFCLSLIIEFISLLLPVGTQLVMDHVIPATDFGLLSLICLSLFVITLLQASVIVWRSWSVIIMDTLTDIQWKDGLFRHLLRLPLSWFEKRKLGDIQSRFGSLGTMRLTFIHDIIGSIINGIMVIGSLAMLILYGHSLVFIVLGFTALYVLLRMFTFSRYKQLSEERLIKDANASSYLTETLFGIATVRAQGIAGLRRRNWLTLTTDAANASVTLNKFDMLFSIVSTFINTCDNLVILWLGISFVMERQMTIGTFVAFGTFRAIFSDRALSLTDIFLHFRMLSMHNERVADIALTKAEYNAPERDIFPPGVALSLFAENLSFRYDNQSPYTFSNLNLSLNAGESVAIIGPSGCGKTTLMKLLCGLTKPTEGKILASGKDIHGVGVNNYCKVVACILQEDRLFAGSLRENISGFSVVEDEGWLKECAQLSYIYEDIINMPMGFDTLIGELGEGLSGGQRQRIFIARALYRKPGILFMDEATSHLDERNEALINKAISSLNITRVIIAHRPSTISSADRTIIINNGIVANSLQQNI
ncbi:peptidase domain-containing ABC transporter [Yersinia enterocolitica]